MLDIDDFRVKNVS
jgi:hypothetical protein